MTYEEILKRQERDGDAIMGRPGVHAVGIGKTEEGDPCLRVHMQEGAAEVLKDDPLLAGCEIVTEEAPVDDILRIPAEEGKNLTYDMGRYRPMLGGIQISLTEGRVYYLGTLSCFVRSNDPEDKETYLLSNQHVLMAEGKQVYQSMPDAADRVAVVTDAKKRETSDAAIAKLTQGEFCAGMAEELGKINGVRPVAWDDIGKRAMKRGRTTGKTYGIIKGVDYAVKSSGKVTKGCVMLESPDGSFYSSGGDSGSPVLFEEDHALLGIHFAGSGAPEHRYGWASGIDYVFRDLNIKLAES